MPADPPELVAAVEVMARALHAHSFDLVDSPGRWGSLPSDGRAVWIRRARAALDKAIESGHVLVLSEEELKALVKDLDQIQPHLDDRDDCAGCRGFAKLSSALTARRSRR